AIASSSVLKAASAIQNTGKAITAATSHPSAVRARTDAVRFRIVAALELPRDGAHEEGRYDGGQDDREDPAGRGPADVKRQEGARIDEEGQVGRRQSRSANGCDQDLSVDCEK